MPLTQHPFDGAVNGITVAFVLAHNGKMSGNFDCATSFNVARMYVYSFGEFVCLASSAEVSVDMLAVFAWQR